MLDQSMFQNYRVEGVKFVTTDNSGTYSLTLAPTEAIVRVDTTAGVGTLVLPPTAESRGKFVSIAIIAGANRITPADQSDSEHVDPAAEYTIDAVGDGVVLFCDGLRWWAIASHIA